MNKIKLLLLLAIPSFFMCSNASALENIEINSEDDYFNAISTINTSAENNFVVTLGSNITLTAFPSSSNPTNIASGKTVTFLGDGHKIKISNTGSYGYHGILTVGSGATVNLGNNSGADTLGIEGGGAGVDNSESLISVSGTVNMYAGTSIGNNQAEHGALVGGAFHVLKNGTVNMYGGRVHDNRAGGTGYGGAMMLDDENATFNMYDGIFENNSTSDAYGAYGGAILILDTDHESAAVNIKGGTFRNNSSYFGGAVANIFGILNVSNATFENNTATSTSIGPDDPAGGAILQYGQKTATIENSTFIGNNAISGGAVFDYGGRLNLYSSTFKNNTATNKGGAAYDGAYGTLVSNESIYEGNSAANGGAIYSERATYTVDDVIKDNNATIGGGVYAAGTTRNTITSVIYNNKATTSANDVYISTSAVNVTLSDASTFDAFAVFSGKTLKIDGWYKDEAGDRYTYLNRTTAVAYDSISAGTEYFLTAAGDAEYVKVSFTGADINIDDQFVVKGGTIATLPSPTRAHYTFAGWFTNAGLTDAFGTTSALDADTILYAKWISDNHSITINPDGGSYGGSTTNTVIEKGNGETYTLINPVRAGYTFKGWTVTPASAYNEATNTITMGDADITVVAKWAAASAGGSTTTPEGEEEGETEDEDTPGEGEDIDDTDDYEDDINVPDTNSDDLTVPNTADNISFYITVIALSALVLACGLVYLKEKKNN